MASYNNPFCIGCPYINQNHLVNTQFYIQNAQPLSIQTNINSDILIVFQSPGEFEWRNNTPLSSDSSHSARARIENSWRRTGHKRQEYDITNAVQCYTGKSNSRDLKPRIIPIRKCIKWLCRDIKTKKYTRIITFGIIAYQSVDAILQANSLLIPLSQSIHPCGGLSNTLLDSLW
ncbi:MAG: uracil-DNA glycosylase family protein [Candidatus Cloacimonadales bacterium]|jgi:uracil-DNA glycosylase family 4|nr:uracil-DNA glycosylase family protein [Acholeplasmataceae bacterium]MDX9977621.1 uracil-DNA glycosylase family protein [Candidatus Cloacimonadales bacterium]